jgi:ATP-dependent Lon protease
MFFGNWNFNFSYKRGNIVYLPYHKQYYICLKNHVSNEVSQIYPPEQEYYWIQIDPTFLNSYLLSNSMSGILFEFANQNYKPIYKCDDDNENENTIKNSKENDNDNDNETSQNDDQKLKSPDIEIILFTSSNHQDEYQEENEESNIKKPTNKKLKRKLETIESKIYDYKRKKLNSDVDDLRDQLLLLNLDIPTKSFLLDKYENTKRLSGSDYTKSINWLKTVSNIPHGKFKNFKINKDDPEEVKNFFTKAKEKFDKQILGLDDVKQEILEFIARKITNPKSKGHVLALCGPPGIGKTKISKCLSEILELPFFQINCGGLNDSSVLIGHSETYVGAKPGKIVEILQKSNFMNPIIYLDEIDKLGKKSEEINGILTHLLDEEQNDKFQDNYLSSVNLNLSQAFFIISFNDITKVDSIVSDRMKVIYINPPSIDEKVDILETKMLPEILKNINLKEHIQISRETIEYVIKNKCTNEKGVRNLKKTFEKILYKFNYDILLNTENLKHVKKHKNKCDEYYEITRSYIDYILTTENTNQPWLSMYL